MHLTEMAHHDNIKLQVLPFTATETAGVNSPFLILQFAEFSDLDVVLVEHATSGLYLGEEEEMRCYNGLFEHLMASALSPTGWVALTHEIAEGLR